MPKDAIDVAIGGKADMTCCTAYVCLWPKADINGAAQRHVDFAQINDRFTIQAWATPIGSGDRRLHAGVPAC